MPAEEPDRIAFIRRQLASLGLTQPQYWILRYLAPNDLGADAPGRTLQELSDFLQPYLLPGDDLQAEADALLADDLVSRSCDTCLRITPAGQAAHARVKRSIPTLRTLLNETLLS
ncbi:hypothetical protein [Streptomyces sp. NPDC006368]|uniref:hypothetical protein n=1 Tax=Streptomyces sp. NPDC006368 TaxID=3156760 RepID=UPI0033BB67EA